RNLCIQAIYKNKQKRALRAFGRMTHTIQDFYAHSNFIQLWIRNLHGEVPNLNRLDCVDNKILKHSNLLSHKTIFPGDYIALLPGMARFLKPHLPKTSHTCMNLDSPESGENFTWAYSAAVLRTKLELNKLIERLECSQNEIDLFLGRI
ncbi:MAG: Het-C domain-containing protein, partial [Anaerolineaceae bacterium]|nr:Het-C domain-containing protein [Anaerolineaceae bacterium]